MHCMHCDSTSSLVSYNKKVILRIENSSLRIHHFVIILDIKYRLSGITVSVIFSPVAGVKV